MAYDPATKSVVLFGGKNGSGALGDTWTWNGTTWTEQHPVRSPSPRAHAVMAYSPTSKDVVLFGGEPTNGGQLGDTWTWNGTTWTEQHPPQSPPPRWGAVFALDPTSAADVLFGGAGHGLYGDTWTWTGSDWTQEHPKHSPPPVGGAALAWDGPQRELVLYGGITNGAKGPVSTWTWSRADWHRHAGRPNPGGLQTTEAASAGRSGVLLFGGLQLATGSTLGGERKTWLWSGNRWRRIRVASPPLGRYAASIAYDRDEGQVVLFGGTNSRAHRTPADTWTFR